MEREVVGEGTYGCVHRPSLRCENDKDIQGKKVDYKDTISKLSHFSEMNEEMKNYVVIEKLDKKKQFYTGTPVTCMPKKDAEFNRAVNKCLINGNEYKKGNTGLLVIKDGGHDLGVFAETFQQMDPNNPDGRVVLNTFWWEMVRILKGIQMFLKKKFIHFDLKETNIVYNDKKKRANFIDFGTLVEQKTVEEEANRGLCTRCASHWSYPFEIQFLKKNNFKNDYKAKNTDLYYSILNDIFSVGQNVNVDWKTKQAVVKGKEKLLLEKKENADDIPFYSLNSNSQIVILYQEYKSPNLPHFLKEYLTDIKTFLQQHNEWTYEKFLEKSLKTTDIYGLGITFIYVLKYTRPFMEPAFFNEMYRLSFRMITPDLKKRYTIEPLLKDYITLLNKYIPEYAPTKQPVVKKKKECPEGKVINPATGRCIKKPVSKKMKICPEGKVINPTTGRCIKNKTVRTRRVLKT